MSQTTTAASSQAQSSFDWVLSCFSHDSLNRLGEEGGPANDVEGGAGGEVEVAQEVQVGEPLPILRKGGATLAFLAEKRGEVSPRVDVTSLCRNTFVHLDTASPLARLSQPQLLDSFRAFSNRLTLNLSPPLKAPTVSIAAGAYEPEDEEETSKTPLANISQQEFDAVWRDEGADDIDPRTDEDLCAEFPTTSTTTSWPPEKLDEVGRGGDPDAVEPFFRFLAPAPGAVFDDETQPPEAIALRTPARATTVSTRTRPFADFDLQAWLAELTSLEEREQALPGRRGKAEGVGPTIVRGNLCDIVTDYQQIARLTNIYCCTIAQSLLQPPSPAEAANDGKARVGVGDLLAESGVEHGSVERKAGVEGGLSGHPHSCKPCAFYWSKGCLNGDACQFCHLWHAPKKKKPMKEQKNLMIIARDDGKISFLRCAIEDALGG